jgi:hypothetical protein
MESTRGTRGARDVSNHSCQLSMSPSFCSFGFACFARFASRSRKEPAIHTYFESSTSPLACCESSTRDLSIRLDLDDTKSSAHDLDCSISSTTGYRTSYTYTQRNSCGYSSLIQESRKASKVMSHPPAGELDHSLMLRLPWELRQAWGSWRSWELHNPPVHSLASQASRRRAVLRLLSS